MDFVETNIWKKWYIRSKLVYGDHYSFFLRNRIHMGSHWAGIAMYLNKLTDDSEIKEQTHRLVEQYDLLAKRNLKVNEQAYIWNATYDNVEGTGARKAEGVVIQDVSHGNHVVAYIIVAYELGNPNWTQRDIDYLSNTLVDYIYQAQTNTFADNVDGTKDDNRPGWGNFVADGWVKLAQYNQKAESVLKKFNHNERLLRKYNQALQFKATIR